MSQETHGVQERELHTWELHVAFFGCGTLDHGEFGQRCVTVCREYHNQPGSPEPWYPECFLGLGHVDWLTAHRADLHAPSGVEQVFCGLKAAPQ